MAPRAILFVVPKGVAAFVNVGRSVGFDLFVDGGGERRSKSGGVLR